MLSLNYTYVFSIWKCARSSWSMIDYAITWSHVYQDGDDCMPFCRTYRINAVRMRVGERTWHIKVIVVYACTVWCLGGFAEENIKLFGVLLSRSSNFVIKSCVVNDNCTTYIQVFIWHYCRIFWNPLGLVLSFSFTKLPWNKILKFQISNYRSSEKTKSCLMIIMLLK